MTSEIVEAGTARLEEWGKWLQHSGGVHLGFAAIRTMRAGSDGNSRVVVEHPEAQQVEGLLLELQKADPEIFDSLMQRFYYRASDQEGAARCHCSVSGYRAHVRNGAYWIAGCCRSARSVAPSIQ